MDFEELLRQERELVPPNPLIDRTEEILRGARRRRRTRALAGTSAVAVVLAAGALVTPQVAGTVFVSTPANEASVDHSTSSPPVPAPLGGTSTTAQQVTVDVLATIPIGPFHAHDLEIDTASGYLFLTDRTDGALVAVAPDSGGAVTAIPLEGHGYGIAMDDGSGLLYVAVTHEAMGSVAVVDTTTRQLVHTIAIGAGTDPYEVAFDHVTERLFVANLGDSTISVIDTLEREVIATIPTVGGVLGFAVDAQRGAVYASVEDGLAIIDTRTLSWDRTVRGVFATQLAFDPIADVVLAAREGTGKVAVVDAATSTVKRQIEVGGRGPFMMEVDPKAHVAYVVGGPRPVGSSRALVVMDMTTFDVRETLRAAQPLVDGPMATDEAAGVVYIGLDGEITVIARR